MFRERYVACPFPRCEYNEVCAVGRNDVFVLNVHVAIVKSAVAVGIKHPTYERVTFVECRIISVIRKCAHVCVAVTDNLRAICRFVFCKQAFYGELARFCPRRYEVVSHICCRSLKRLHFFAFSVEFPALEHVVCSFGRSRKCGCYIDVDNNIIKRLAFNTCFKLQRCGGFCHADCGACNNERVIFGCRFNAFADVEFVVVFVCFFEVNARFAVDGCAADAVKHDCFVRRIGVRTFESVCHLQRAACISCKCLNLVALCVDCFDVACRCAILTFE